MDTRTENSAKATGAGIESRDGGMRRGPIADTRGRGKARDAVVEAARQAQGPETRG